jgi:phosphate transport system permease protein
MSRARTVNLTGNDDTTVKAFVASGQPYVWITAAAVAASIIITLGLLGLIAARGMVHFWPQDVVQATYRQPGAEPQQLLAEIRSREAVTSARLASAGLPVDSDQPMYDRALLKIGNRDLNGVDFRYVVETWLENPTTPPDVVVLERDEWGNFQGFIDRVTVDGEPFTGDAAWPALQRALQRSQALRDEIEDIEKGAIGWVNHILDSARLEERRLELRGLTRESNPEAFREIDATRAAMDAEYGELATARTALYRDLRRDTVVMRAIDDRTVTLDMSKVIRAHRPNAMSVFEKLGSWFSGLWRFVTDDPREANTEGGIFPAIFGTVMMVLLMSVFVTPFGILAALYLREYARQGTVTRMIRIAVNNLAGVPSIVYGMFGLGFFVYTVGGNIDDLFYPEAAPSPVFGTPGILWASLTLAILTLPVVIVATEEGLARIPRHLREASLALGATKAETLWRVVLPMASPAMMTGLILAIARAAGEVAPLMLVGVVKLAPSLPFDLNFPFLHLDRKFMHLGFHIYDVGFQSPNVEAARPLVYATSFLLVMVIMVLNLTAVAIRNRLREKYKALDG